MMILKCRQINLAQEICSQLIVGCRLNKVGKAEFRNPEMDIEEILAIAQSYEQ